MVINCVDMVLFVEEAGVPSQSKFESKEAATCGFELKTLVLKV